MIIIMSVSSKNTFDNIANVYGLETFSGSYFDTKNKLLNELSFWNDSFLFQKNTIKSLFDNIDIDINWLISNHNEKTNICIDEFIDELKISDIWSSKQKVHDFLITIKSRFLVDNKNFVRWFSLLHYFDSLFDKINIQYLCNYFGEDNIEAYILIFDFIQKMEILIKENIKKIDEQVISYKSYICIMDEYIYLQKNKIYMIAWPDLGKYTKNYPYLTWQFMIKIWPLLYDRDLLINQIKGNTNKTIDELSRHILDKSDICAKSRSDIIMFIKQYFVDEWWWIDLIDSFEIKNDIRKIYLEKVFANILQLKKLDWIYKIMILRILKTIENNNKVLVKELLILDDKIKDNLPQAKNFN